MHHSVYVLWVSTTDLALYAQHGSSSVHIPVVGAFSVRRSSEFCIYITVYSRVLLLVDALAVLSVVSNFPTKTILLPVDYLMHSRHLIKFFE